MANKNLIRKNRTNGLKKYDIALTKIDENTLIEKSIELYNETIDKHLENMTPYFKQDNYCVGYEWKFFHRNFLSIMRKVLVSINKKYIETSISFNLDEALTDNQIEYIASKCNIKDPYIGIYPRK